MSHPSGSALPVHPEDTAVHPGQASQRAPAT
jgi:hypothetical protein